MADLLERLRTSILTNGIRAAVEEWRRDGDERG
jgi:hypothetical protein